jgi:hypothetical protein
MSERDTLRAIYETVRYLQKDAEAAGAEGVALYLRLAAIEAEKLLAGVPPPEPSPPPE